MDCMVPNWSLVRLKLSWAATAVSLTEGLSGGAVGVAAGPPPAGLVATALLGVAVPLAAMGEDGPIPRAFLPASTPRALSYPLPTHAVFSMILIMSPGLKAFMPVRAEFFDAESIRPVIGAKVPGA